MLKTGSARWRRKAAVKSDSFSQTSENTQEKSYDPVRSGSCGTCGGAYQLIVWVTARCLQLVESSCGAWLLKLWSPWCREVVIANACMTSEKVGIKWDTTGTGCAAITDLRSQFSTGLAHLEGTYWQIIAFFSFVSNIYIMRKNLIEMQSKCKCIITKLMSFLENIDVHHKRHVKNVFSSGCQEDTTDSSWKILLQPQGGLFLY